MNGFACSYLVGRHGVDIPALEKNYGIAASEFKGGLPRNDAIKELPNALAAAHKHYGVKEYVENLPFSVQSLRTGS